MIVRKVQGRLSRLTGRVALQALRSSAASSVGSGVRLVGRPDISLHPDASLRLAEDVVINSFRPGYHTAMYGPARLIADVAGASIEVGQSSRLNGCVVHAQDEIRIGRSVLIAAQAVVIDSNGHPLVPPTSRTSRRDTPRPVLIEDNVWIGVGAVILPGSHIGQGSVIGANAVVSGTVPPESVVRAVMRVEPLRRENRQEWPPSDGAPAV